MSVCVCIVVICLSFCLSMQYFCVKLLTHRASVFTFRLSKIYLSDGCAAPTEMSLDLLVAVSMCSVLPRMPLSNVGLRCDFSDFVRAPAVQLIRQ